MTTIPAQGRNDMDLGPSGKEAVMAVLETDKPSRSG